MKTIWKWKLAMHAEETVQMPWGAKILTVQTHGQVPQLWALCDPEAAKVPRRIAIYGTGQQTPDAPGEYIGTFALQDGAFVFHAFEVK